LFAALVLVWAWPALATVLEASQAVATFQASLTDRGWPKLADRLDDWPGSRSVIKAQGVEPGALLNPASASLSSDRETVSRPLRLGIETLGLVLLTELLTLPLGVALAWFLFRSDTPGASVFLGILALAVFVPLPLHATAWLGAFGNVGRLQALGSRPILVGRIGAAAVHALAALPWVVLLVGVGLRGVESELEDSADLDRSPWWVSIHVTLRRGLGGIAAAALAVAVLTAGDMTVTDLLQIRTYAEEAYLQSILGEGPASASAVAIPPMLVLGPLIGFMAWSLTRAEPRRLASVYAGPPRRRLNAWRMPVGIGLFLVVGLFAGLPIYGLLWRAGRVGGRAMLGQPPQWSLIGLVGTMREALDDSWEPLETSLVWSAVAALIATALAWALAWLCRGSWFWRLTTLLTVATCLAAPGPVAGMALKIAYRTSDAISDSAAILVLGLVSRILPYAVFILWPAIRMIPPELLEIAAISGYGPCGQLRRVAVPFTRSTIWLTWAVCFALAIGELPATNLVLPAGITTISMRVWTLLHTGVESHLAGVTLVMLAVVAGAGLLVLAGARSLGRSTVPSGIPCQHRS
jgi:iron(III) transport system permease protein